jgi:hypothetical protein
MGQWSIIDPNRFRKDDGIHKFDGRIIDINLGLYAE